MLKAQSRIKVIFEDPGKLFTAGRVQDHYPECNFYSHCFKALSKEVFSQANLTILPSIFYGIVFKLVPLRFWFCQAFFGSPNRLFQVYSDHFRFQYTNWKAIYRQNKCQTNMEVFHNFKVQKSLPESQNLFKTKYQFLTVTLSYFITLFS